jgi:hypothetical protein
MKTGESCEAVMLNLSLYHKDMSGRIRPAPKPIKASGKNFHIVGSEDNLTLP